MHNSRTSAASLAGHILHSQYGQIPTLYKCTHNCILIFHTFKWSLPFSKVVNQVMSLAHVLYLYYLNWFFLVPKQNRTKKQICLHDDHPTNWLFIHILPCTKFAVVWSLKRIQNLDSKMNTTSLSFVQKNIRGNIICFPFILCYWWWQQGQQTHS